MVEVPCCGACQHLRYTHEDEPLCVHGLPPAEAEGLGAWRPGSAAATVDLFGLCDAYERTPTKEAPLPEQEQYRVAPDPVIAKLDALAELVEALGELVEGMAEAVVASPDAERRLALALLMARRRGRCTTCLGVGFGRNEVWDKVPCSACNGTGKAKQGDGDV